MNRERESFPFSFCNEKVLFRAQFSFTLSSPSIELLSSPSVSLFFHPAAAMSSGPLTVFSTGSLTLKDLDKELTPASTDASATIKAKQKVGRESLEEEHRRGKWEDEKSNSHLFSRRPFRRLFLSHPSLLRSVPENRALACFGGARGKKERLPTRKLKGVTETATQ